MSTLLFGGYSSTQIIEVGVSNEAETTVSASSPIVILDGVPDTIAGLNYASTGTLHNIELHKEAELLNNFRADTTKQPISNFMSLVDKDDVYGRVLGYKSDSAFFGTYISSMSYYSPISDSSVTVPSLNLVVDQTKTDGTKIVETTHPSLNFSITINSYKKDLLGRFTAENVRIFLGRKYHVFKYNQNVFLSAKFREVMDALESGKISLAYEYLGEYYISTTPFNFNVYLKIPDDSNIENNSPYTPGSDFNGGYGVPSTGSITVGSFNGTPGPSISENLPVGSSGPDIASSAMYTKYLCNNALLDLLAGFFWEDNIGIQALKAVLGNPIDSIISLTAYPFALETLVPTSATTIYFGQYDSHFSAFSLTKSSFQIDWGSVTIPFFWGSFLDYSPYTKIQLYLPWGVGFVSIDPNEVVPWSSKNSFNQGDFVNGTIRVITNIELDKGACVHNIIGNNGRIIGSFGGVVGKQIPVTGSDNSARILAMISAAVSSSAAIGTSAGGTLAAGKNSAYGNGMTMAERAEGREMIGNYKSYVGNTVQSLSNALSSPPSYPRAGTFSDATNTLGYQYPYLIISRPSQSVPQQYGRFMGYPSNIFHNHLSEVRGYTEVSSIHLDDISATSNELDELESILKGGVLL